MFLIYVTERLEVQVSIAYYNHIDYWSYSSYFSFNFNYHHIHCHLEQSCSFIRLGFCFLVKFKGNGLIEMLVVYGDLILKGYQLLKDLHLGFLFQSQDLSLLAVYSSNPLALSLQILMNLSNWNCSYPSGLNEFVMVLTMLPFQIPVCLENLIYLND